jgi:hypothetical protein
MDLFKTSSGKNKGPSPVTTSKSDALRKQRLEHENAQKAAGTWGDMSVRTITRDERVFVHCCKGNLPVSLSEMALKKPKEINDADHAALTQWLKTGRFENFVQAFAAWNVSAEEADRIKASLVAKHKGDGLTVVNQLG